MNKLSLIVTFLFISIMLSGCKKDGEVQDPRSSLKKIKTITTGETTSTGDVIQNTKVFEYNSDGKLSRVIETVFSAGTISHIDTTTHYYSRDSVKSIRISSGYVNGQLISNTTIQKIVLNSNGYISSCVTSQTGQPDWVETYQYDKSGYCIKVIQLSGSTQFVQDLKYSGGNMVSLIYNTGSQVINEELTYYLDKINTISPCNNWLGNFGKGSMNLVKTDKLIIQGSPGFTFSFEYEFDVNNYVTKRTTIQNNSSYWDKYTYQ